MLAPRGAGRERERARVRSFPHIQREVTGSLHHLVEVSLWRWPAVRRHGDKGDKGS